MPHTNTSLTPLEEDLMSCRGVPRMDDLSSL